MKNNGEAASQSASWGLGQVMGFYGSLCRYSSAKAMVTDVLDSEGAQLEAMVQFIISAGLDDELRRYDWSGFGRGYNGPAYARYNCHHRLKAAFGKLPRYSIASKYS